MPGQALSLSVTDAYRERLLGLRDSALALTRSTWRGVTMDDLQGSFDRWRTFVTTATVASQQQAARASTGYLVAFLTSETGSGETPPIDSNYVGKTRDGDDLYDYLDGALIGVRVSFKRGLGIEQAFREGLNRALGTVEGAVMHAGRATLNDLMEAHPDIEGWQRAVKGTCGACSGDIEVEVSVEMPGVPLMVHPHCQCVTQPVVVGVPNRFPLLTGQQIMDSKTPAEQEAALGTAAAEAYREGDVSLADLVATARDQDFITQRPLDAALN